MTPVRAGVFLRFVRIHFFSLLRRTGESLQPDSAIISVRSGRKTLQKAEKTNENGLISGFGRETHNCGYLATFPVWVGNLFRFVSVFPTGLEK
ncbi:hypothetical protein OK142_00135 [Agrobacterium sp. BT-220-3]|jgi:hypothetical protein|nr:hypothetical protein [Agrobacterium sp. BT-220-3]